MRSLRDQIANRCVHFNGVQNDRCRAGCSYQEIRATAPVSSRLPCFREDLFRPGRERPAPPCEQQRFPTDEEIAAKIAESEAALTRYQDAIDAGLCPECEQPVEPLRQDSCCVYAACGHRLGQGRVADYRRARRAHA